MSTSTCHGSMRRRKPTAVVETKRELIKLGLEIKQDTYMHDRSKSHTKLTLWNFHSRNPQNKKICNIGPGPTAAIASTGFSDMYAGPGKCTSSETSHPTTASIATRPCLSSDSLMNFAGKMVERPKGSKPTSPTMPSRFLGLSRKGMDFDIAGGAAGAAGAASASADDMRTVDAGALVITLEKEAGVTNAEAHDAHAVTAPTVERTFIVAE